MKIHIKSGNLGRNLKITGVILVLLALIGGAVSLTVIVNSNTAVNEYIADINKQYSEIVNSKDDDPKEVKPVQLKEVALADVINSKYHQTAQLTKQYDQLISRLYDYKVTLSAHNKLVKELNAGLDGDEILTSNVLDLTQKMIEIFKSHYPKATDAISGLQSLEAKISTSSKFTEISGQMHSTLTSNESWLQNERNSIENSRNEFRQAINKAAGATENNNNNN